MSKENHLLFAWKNFIFITYLCRSELFLKWRNTNSSLSSDGEDTDKHLSDNDSSDYYKVTESSSTKIKPEKIYNSRVQEHNTSSLNVGRWKYCEFVTVGFSFDQTCFQRTPVLLLKCANVNNEFGKIEYIFIQVQDIGTDFVQTLQFGAKDRRSAEFKLMPIRSYSLNTFCDFTSFTNHPVFFSGLQLLHVNSDHNSGPLRLFTQDRFSSQSFIKDFSFPDSYKNISDIQVLDAFSVIEDATFIAVISFKTDKDLIKCLCLQFSTNLVMKSDSTAENYDMVQVPVDILFPPDFTEILKVVSISTFSSSNNVISKSHSFKTSVVIITHTGYALKFSDGVLHCCVNLIDHSTQYGFSPEAWSGARVKIVNFDGSPDRTALQVNSICHLIDWTRERIVTSWQSVVKAVSCDVFSCGVSSLVLVFESENAHFSDTLSSHQLLEDSQLRVVDLDDECQRENAHGEVSADSEVTKVHSDDEFVGQPLCAVKALLGQQKKCEEAVAEMKSELSSKLSFLSDTWQQLSNLHIHEANQSAPRKMNSHQPPLALLIEGSLPSSQGSKERQDPVQPTMKYVEIGSVWKRVVGSLLVVGAAVRNVSGSTLTDIFINIIPGNLCHGGIFQTSSTCRRKQTLNTEPDFSGIPAESDMSLQKKTTNIKFGQGSDLNTECLLPPGHSTVTTSTVDISQAISAADLIFHIFLNYVVLGAGSCPPDALGEGGCSARDVEEYCAEIIITSMELINQTYSLGVRLDASETLTTVDLHALDSVQKSMTLVIQSVVSSVTCLSVKLTSQPSIRYLEWAEQFLFVTNHWLKFCRIQVLEKCSKNKSKIKTFARSHSEALMLLKFLYSILPEDITITPQKSSSLSLVTLIGHRTLQDIESKISTVKHQIESKTTGVPSSDEAIPQPISPTFHTTKSFRRKPILSGNINAKLEPWIQASVASSSCSIPTESRGGKSNVVKEREVFRQAKKRFREMWADEDSPESG